MTPKSPILFDFRANYYSDLKLWDRPEFEPVPLVRKALAGAPPDIRTNLDDAPALTLLQRFILLDVFAERRAGAGTKYESNLAFILPGLTQGDLQVAERALEKVGDPESGLLGDAMRPKPWLSGSRAVRASGRKYAIHDTWIPMQRRDRAWLFLMWHLTWRDGPQKLAEHWRDFVTNVDAPTWWRERYGARALDFWPNHREPSAGSRSPPLSSGVPIISVIASDRPQPQIDVDHMRLTRPASWDKAIREHTVAAQGGRKDARLNVKTVQEALLKVVALTYVRLRLGHQLVAGPPASARPPLKDGPAQMQEFREFREPDQNFP